MPRKLRLSYAGAIHHVMSRCNHQEHLFEAPDHQDWCALLLETKSRFGIRLFAYALLHNHYHLLIQEPAPGILSKAMHWFNGSVALRYNLRHKLSGHLWQGRYKNRLIQNDGDFLPCLLYVDLNPARAGLARGITDWPFSSGKAHAEGTPDPLLDPLPVEIPSYKDLLLNEWKRTEGLRTAIQHNDKTTAKQWLRQFLSGLFIPYHRELVLLLGHNYRRYTKGSGTSVQWMRKGA